MTQNMFVISTACLEKLVYQVSITSKWSQFMLLHKFWTAFVICILLQLKKKCFCVESEDEDAQVR
jgi:hypothetical protein